MDVDVDADAVAAGLFGAGVVDEWRTALGPDARWRRAMIPQIGVCCMFGKLKRKVVTFKMDREYCDCVYSSSLLTRVWDSRCQVTRYARLYWCKTV